MKAKDKIKKSKSKSSKKDGSKETSKSKSNKSNKSSKDKSIKSDKKSNKSKSQNEEPNPTQEEEQKITNELSHNNPNIKSFYPNQQSQFINTMQRSLEGGNYVEKCDGCFDSEAICYCKNCEKSYCSICDGQIHVIPAYRTHEKVPLSEMTHLKKLCYHHSNPLKFFCESCEEPICSECQVIGPHNTKLHRISNLIDAYKEKYQNVNNLIQNSLMKKYEILTGNLDLIDQKINEVDKVANNIETEINMSYSAMLEHLKSEKGKRLAVLNYESAMIQKEIVKLDEIVNSVKDSNEENDMLGFLLRYNQLNEQIEEVLSKSTKLKLDDKLTQLPSEFLKQQEKLNNYLKLEKLIKLKDDIIWELIQKSNPPNTSEYKQNAYQNDRYGLMNRGNRFGNYTSIKSSRKDAEVNKTLVKKIRDKIKRNNINFYQVLCENGNDKEMIKVKDIPKALFKINIDLNEKDVPVLLNTIKMKKEIDVSIKDLAREIIMFDE